MHQRLIQYWHAPEPPSDVARLMAGLRRANPQLRHHCYDWAQADAFLATHFPHAVQQAFRACRVPAMGADLFRYAALLVQGGFWADVDWEGHGPLTQLVADAPPALLVLRANGVVANHLFFVHEPGHPLLRLVLELAVWTIRQRLEIGVWLATGPGLFTFVHRACELHSNNPRLIAPEIFALESAADPAAPAQRRWLRQLCNHLPRQSSGLDLMRRVRVIPEARLHPVVRCPATPLVHQQTDQHWAHWQGSIYQPLSV
jgi:mannosyltransferase OCH1-like enzyme